MRRAAAAVGLLAALAFLAACGGGGTAATVPPPPAAATIDVRNVAFNPKSATVHPGEMVAWKFDDGSIAHNVVGADWRSPDRTRGYYTHSFATTGTYAYRCTIHTNMAGEVVVAP